ncbi:MAG: hypothetical protein ACRD2N_23440 [Vicinamibacterales bacterium]
MRWRKLGLVFRPDTHPGWGLSHAMVPTPLVMGDRIRVYFTSLDARGRGHLGFVELDAREPTTILRGPQGPLLDPGAPGDFDQDGVVACSLVQEADRWLLYYVGFELGTQTRYRLLTGLAISRERGESFERVSRTPVLERSDEERLFRVAPFVWKEGSSYRMWYVAGSDWTRVAGKELPVYDLRTIESHDGIHWPAAGRVRLTPADPDEHGFGRPWLVRDPDRHRLFFSVRRRSTAAYRLAYAESRDGRNWTRLDTLGLDVSTSGWDSDAIMYTAVVDAHGQRLCFYNWNEFGRYGFGIAVLESD